ncbi:hypothetical protein KGM_202483 [Danaus plexippus plexippus]|uniref:Uncharacterized protein n=1 Tax=Danaus plexippus plexippus TaxID=278856 RepID=A0A212EXT6_DANPL|nr:hypothetical protein KGM_202483 [Danaus plexippus plexippus]
MQTNVQIDTKALRHSPEHGQQKGNYRVTAESQMMLIAYTVTLFLAALPGTVPITPTSRSHIINNASPT